ncbi:hypothetical protein [Streptomyces sp. NPDC056938]|uniref:hypothetical protein n=1 Tax=unclassified Streptomyces TaxID=2593676 RepID=UPI0036305D72
MSVRRQETDRGGFVALLDQLPALIGVVVGSLGSYAVQNLTERRQWKRQREERWDEKRFETYGRYANALKAQLRVAQRIGASLGFADVADPLQPAAGLPLLADAESRRATEWESVLLAGDPVTIAAARRWHEMIWTIELLVREGPVDAEMWTKAIDWRARRVMPSTRAHGTTSALREIRRRPVTGRDHGEPNSPDRRQVPQVGGEEEQFTTLSRVDGRGPVLAKLPLPGM